MEDSDLYDAMKEMNKRYKQIASDPSYNNELEQLALHFQCEEDRKQECLNNEQKYI